MLHKQTQIIANAVCRVGSQKFLARQLAAPLLFTAIPTSFLEFLLFLVIIVCKISQIGTLICTYIKHIVATVLKSRVCSYDSCMTALQLSLNFSYILLSHIHIAMYVQYTQEYCTLVCPHSNKFTSSINIQAVNL